MKVVAIMATCGRHTLAERSLKFFLDQDYEDECTLLIHNNSNIRLCLGMLNDDFLISSHKEPATEEVLAESNRHIHLLNQDTDSSTGEKYSALGEIYTDALKHVPNDTDAVIHWDDDDIFLPSHITEGVRGLKRAMEKGKRAYKPAKSWYRHAGGIEQMSNTLEPSIFVLASHIREYGYSPTTTDQHLQWVNPLVYNQDILVEEGGKPTLIYNWGDSGIPTFKTSGNAGNPQNFENYRRFSQDHGDRVLTPWSDAQVHEYYNMINAE